MLPDMETESPPVNLPAIQNWKAGPSMNLVRFVVPDQPVVN